MSISTFNYFVLPDTHASHILRMFLYLIPFLLFVFHDVFHDRNGCLGVACQKLAIITISSTHVITIKCQSACLIPSRLLIRRELNSFVIEFNYYLIEIQIVCLFVCQLARQDLGRVAAAGYCFGWTCFMPPETERRVRNCNLLQCKSSSYVVWYGVPVHTQWLVGNQLRPSVKCYLLHYTILI